MAWCRWPYSQATLQWKRRLAAVAKQNGGPIQHILLLISWLIRNTVTFWCSLCTTNNINDELLLHTSFYDVQYYFGCITANMEAFYVKIHRHIRRCLLITYMLFCWFISPTLLHNAMRKFGTFFFGPPSITHTHHPHSHTEKLQS